MNIEQTKQAIEVMQAYVDGRDIEFTKKDVHTGQSDNPWELCVKPGWDWIYNIYQVRETDWKKVPIDTKIEIRINGEWIKRYFAGYNEKDHLVGYFSNGQTSYTARKENNLYPGRPEYTDIFTLPAKRVRLFG